MDALAGRDRRLGRWSRAQASIAVVLVVIAMFTFHVANLSPDPVSVCFHDELHYFQYAREIADGNAPRFNRVFTPKFPPAYSAVIAPAWWTGGAADFVWWARILNALIAASAVIPAYRLARTGGGRLGRGWAVLAAFLATALPHQIYARFLLAEVLLVPLFLWTALAIARLTMRPGAWTAGFVGLLLAACALTKMAYGMAAPAAILAIVWSVRPWRTAIRTSALVTVTFAVTMAAYFLRDRVLSSDVDVKTLFSYGGEFASAGQLALTTYLHYLATEPAFFALALSPIALVLALHRLLVDVTTADRRTRGLPAFVIASSLCLAPVVAIWVARAIHYASEYHERYFVALWPLFALAFVRQIAKPVGGLRCLLAAMVVGLLLLFLTPAIVLAPGSLGTRFSAIDVPGGGAARFLTTAGEGIGIGKWLLALPLLIAPFALRARPHWPRRLLLGIAAVYWLGSTAIAYGDSAQLIAATRDRWETTWKWVEQTTEPNDVVVHHTQLGVLAYQHAIRRNEDFLFVDDDLTPNWESGLTFDVDTGCYGLPGGAKPKGRLLLLTTAEPGPDRHRVVGRFDDLRLLDLSDGLRPLGRWDGKQPTPRRTGVDGEGWCAPRAELIIPVEYPARYRARLVLAHPGEALLAGPIQLRVRGPSGTLLWPRLVPGEQLEIPWEGPTWSPLFRVEIVADRSFTRDGIERSFRVEGFSITRTE